MKDVDSATKRLDNILMTLYFLVVMLIFAVMLVSGDGWVIGCVARSDSVMLEC